MSRRSRREADIKLTQAICEALKRGSAQYLYVDLKPSMPGSVQKLIVEVDDRGWEALRVAQQEDRTIKTVTEDFDFLMRVRNEITSHYKETTQ